MKVLAMIAAAAALPAVAIFSGCASGGGSPAMPAEIYGGQYVLAEGRTFDAAVKAAAANRRWTAQTLENGTVRCTLVQREHRVVADVVPLPGNAFAIRCVESNIPAKKYMQWADNLRREIVFRAGR